MPEARNALRSRTTILELFQGAAGLMRVRYKPVTVGVVSFAMILAAGSAFAERRTSEIENQLASALSVDPQDLRDEVDAQVRTLGMLPLPEFMRTMEERYGRAVIGPEAPALTKENVGVTYVVRVSPVVISMFLFTCVVMFMASVFFLLLFAAGRENSFEVVRRLPKEIIRMTLLQCWTLVRSWIWIPFAGPFIALYLFPRLSLAPTLLLSGEAGIFESLHESMKRTSGKWANVFLKLLCIGVVAMLLLWPLLVIISIVSLFSLKIGFFLWLASLMTLVAWLAACMTVLAVTTS